MFPRTLLLAALLLPPAAAQCDLQRLASSAFMGTYDHFGYAVALQHGELLVGAPGHYSTQPIGHVHVFRKVGGSWQHVQTIDPPTGGVAWGFGTSLAVHGDLLAVGNPDGFLGHTLQGVVYLFERQGGLWVPTTEIAASDGKLFDEFGRSVALDRSRLVVGASYVKVGTQGRPGAAYVFERTASGWTETAKLMPRGLSSHDHFGWSVALRGDTVVVGEPGPNDYFTTEHGHAWVYLREPSGEWLETQVLESTGPNGGGLFGRAVVLDGERLFVGACFEVDLSPGGYGGAAYVYERAGGTWVLADKLLGNDPTTTQGFGFALAAEGDRLAVGSGLTSSLTTFIGSVFLYERVGTRWRRVWTIEPSDGLLVPSCFAAALALDGGRLVAGADIEDSVAYGAGEAIVYELGEFHDPIGVGVAGQGGFLPLLRGETCGGSSLTVTLQDGLGGAGGVLVTGADSGALPFKGGTLLAAPPWRLFPHVLGGTPGLAGAGNWSIVADVPASLSAPQLVLQAVYPDAAAVGGYSMSAGLRVTIP